MKSNGITVFFKWNIKIKLHEIPAWKIGTVFALKVPKIKILISNIDVSIGDTELAPTQIKIGSTFFIDYCV